MYLLIIGLPLLGTIFAGLGGHFLGGFGACCITVFCITLTFILSCIAFYEVALAGSSCYIEMFKWFDSELITFSWGFLFDTLTVVMLVVVTSISMCVHFYSTEYMANDPHIQRFMAYLSLFTFFMIILVTADNFFQLFLGWEGVGLCSYLLVNFWFGRLQANKAALKAMVVNRIGDIGLALGIFLIYYVFKSIDYSTVFAITSIIYNYTVNFGGIEFSAISLICFFFFIAATGKSAQIGLHTWLPDAMEGPTPVSALIHAATMVTAGVFLIVRCSPLFEFAPNVLTIITISGAMTAFMAASIGLVQNDLKRVIAYSTCSQLGYMMIACGTSGYAVGMFHLTNHAFFKALLFLSAGSIIHALADEQDMRKMGGLLNLLPFTYSMMLIGSLSLMGFPFLTGFYSKDLILEWTYSQFSINGFFAYWMGSLSAFFTAFYSLRVICLTFLKKPSMPHHIFKNVHEAPFRMAAPLLFLSFFSIFIGYFFKDMFVGLGTNFWGNSIFILPQNILILEAEFLPILIKIFPVILSLLGATLSFVLYLFFFKILVFLKFSYIGKHIYIFFNRKWFFDKIYNYLFAHQFLVWGYRQPYQNLDRGFFEYFGPNGFSLLFSFCSNFFKNFYQKYFLNEERFGQLQSISFLSMWGISLFSSMIIFVIFHGNIVWDFKNGWFNAVNFSHHKSSLTIFKPWLVYEDLGLQIYSDTLISPEKKPFLEKESSRIFTENNLKWLDKFSILVTFPLFPDAKFLDFWGLGKLSNGFSQGFFPVEGAKINFGAIPLKDLQKFADFLRINYNPAVKPADPRDLNSIDALMAECLPPGKEPADVLKNFDKIAQKLIEREKLGNVDEKIKAINEHYKKDPNFKNWSQEEQLEFLRVYLINNDTFEWWFKNNISNLEGLKAVFEEILRENKDVEILKNAQICLDKTNAYLDMFSVWKYILYKNYFYYKW